MPKTLQTKCKTCLGGQNHTGTLQHKHDLWKSLVVLSYFPPCNGNFIYIWCCIFKRRIFLFIIDKAFLSKGNFYSDLTRHFLARAIFIQIWRGNFKPEHIFIQIWRGIFKRGQFLFRFDEAFSSEGNFPPCRLYSPFFLQLYPINDVSHSGAELDFN